MNLIGRKESNLADDMCTSFDLHISQYYLRKIHSHYGVPGRRRLTVFLKYFKDRSK